MIPSSLSFSTQTMSERDLYAFRVGFLFNFNAIVIMCSIDHVQLSV